MKRIFLLEDDAALNRGITMALTGSDRAVTQAVSFTEAREMLAAAQFDLYILDINLPGGRGLELLRLMRQNGDQTPVIPLTANDLPNPAVICTKSFAPVLCSSSMNSLSLRNFASP